MPGHGSTLKGGQLSIVLGGVSTYARAVRLWSPLILAARVMDSSAIYAIVD